MKDSKIRMVAFNKLIDYGVLIPMENLDLYHGRVNEDGSTWQVDPSFANYGNSTGNKNVFGVSSLSVASSEIANQFAIARMRKTKGSSEIHKIVSEKGKQAYIYNYQFDWKSISEEDSRTLRMALNTLSNYTISKLDPAKFEEKDECKNIFTFLKSYFSKHQHGEYITYNEITEAKEEYEKAYGHSSLDIYYKLVGALNARKLFINNPNYIINKFTFTKGYTNRETIHIDQGNGVIEDGPLNIQYISSWLKNNHIIGVQADIDSATLDKEISACFLFDKSKIGTESQIGDRQQAILNEYGELSLLLENFSGLGNMDKLLREQSCEDVTNFFRKNNEINQLYEVVPQHIWEGYNIGEHTEAVLRAFENTYEDKVPTEILPFIKTIILSHDLGKGTVDRSKEKEENAKQSRHLFNQMQIPENIQELMLFVINESQQYTSDYYINKNVTSKYMLRNACTRKLQEVFGKASEGMIEGLVSICNMLQNCDSISYTRYGTIRDSKTGTYYHGGNSKWTMGARLLPEDISARAAELIPPEDTIENI